MIHGCLTWVLTKATTKNNSKDSIEGGEKKYTEFLIPNYESGYRARK